MTGVPRTDGRRRTHPAFLIRAGEGVNGEQLRRRLRLACVEEDMTYAELISSLLDERDKVRAKMRHPLDRDAVGR
ncbi:ribbon-helix-helix DNA binding domain protein [Gordonia phage LittleMunchkin]|nr:ribbon-helix-helix DNA binding domain protein [Gordonia phage LittleMunchkin]